jgi:phenylacetate-CoA ligase
MRVGDLLSQYSGLTFFADDYLLAGTLTAALDKRLRDFVDGADHGLAIGEALRNGALQHLDAYAGATSLQELPSIDKQDLRTRPSAFQVDGALRWVKMTTGTTGAPVPIVYDAPFYFEALLLSHLKIAIRAGLQDRIAGASVFCAGINDKKSAEEMVIADPANRTGVSLQWHVDERDSQSFERVITMLLALRPLCITSKPSLLEQFCSIAGARGKDIGKHLAFVTSSGSTLMPAARARIEECFGTPVINAYTMTELGLIASECAAGAMHVDRSAVLVEPMDGFGELTIGSIRNSAMPLLRYRTGDSAALVDGLCACGTEAQRLERLTGKQIGCFRLAGGGLFSPTFFNDLLTRFRGLTEFQIAQAGIGRYHVTVEATADANLEALCAYVADAIPGEPRVTIERGLLAGDAAFQRYRTDA